MIDAPTRRWWTLLRGASVLNLVLLGLTATLVTLDGGERAIQLGCATVYTVVCAFRSYVPRVDLERTVLVDHWASSIVLGRTSATVAELAFTVQIALFLGGLGEVTGLDGLRTLAWVVVPLIALAQLCCWLGVLTLDHLWHAAEEALWGLMMVLLAGAFLWALPSAPAPYGAVLPLGVLSCLVGGGVMLGLDVPMYVRRRRSEVAAGTAFLSVVAGFRDALHRREPTGSWDVWKHEVAWMTPYFTAGVWLSLALVWL